MTARTQRLHRIGAKESRIVRTIDRHDVIDERRRRQTIVLRADAAQRLELELEVAEPAPVSTAVATLGSVRAGAVGASSASVGADGTPPLHQATA